MRLKRRAIHTYAGAVQSVATARVVLRAATLARAVRAERERRAAQIAARPIRSGRTALYPQNKSIFIDPFLTSSSQSFW